MNTESLAALFKTLSEPVRLRIVYLLLESGELCVCDLVDTLGLSQSVVSRQSCLFAQQWSGVYPARGRVGLLPHCAGLLRAVV